jgi:hypothetical protein
MGPILARPPLVVCKRSMTPTRRQYVLAAVAAVLAVAGLAACGGDDGGADDTQTDAEVPVTDPSTGKPAPPGRLPDKYPPSTTTPGDEPPAPAPDVTVPEHARARVDAAVADLSARLASEPATISVVDYRDVTWGDGSLGCPRPDTMYIQRLTPGTLLVLRAANGTTFEYHGGPEGALSYCASPRPPVEGQGAQ